MQQADTERIVDYILKNEGGYANSVHDTGGETIFGISRRYNPVAWQAGPPTMEQAREIWKGNGPDGNGYLKEWALERFPQRIANKLTDLLCPRNNLPEAIQVLQRALWAANGQKLKVDGMYGPITRGRMEDQCRYVAGELMLLACLRCEIAAQYRLLVANSPSQEPNLNGWLNRAYGLAT